MPQIKVPRLYRNRCGVYCFRVKTAAADKRVSLRTKCPRTATMLALHLNTQIEQGRTMASDPKNPALSDILPNLDPDKRRRYELDMERGIMRAEGPEDHARMMEALDKFTVVRPRVIPRISDSLTPQPAPVAPTVLKSPLLSQVAADWEVHCTTKNSERTVRAKQGHYTDFIKRVADNVEINTINKAVIVGYKAALLTAGQKAKTIDNKLLTLNDLFKYAQTHGHYTASNENPVSGLFIQTKQERIDKNEPYEQFSREELAKIFEPANYLGKMDEPDLFWAPLIALYTGMRISEVAQLRCKDFGDADGPYLFVYRSKTGAGKRNLPVAESLVRLGLLDYLQEVRNAGAGRLFPNRPYVNGTYGKRLGERFAEYLKELGIKRPHLSFHSFRATVITAMDNDKGVKLRESMAIAGHKHVKGPDAPSIQVHFGYVRDLPDLRPVIDSFEWGLNLNGLKYDGRFNDFVANKKNWKPGQKGTLGGD